MVLLFLEIWLPVVRLSIPLRQALSRMTLPAMLVFSLGCILIGRADQRVTDSLRIWLSDLLAPAYMLVSGPIRAAEHGTGAIGHLFELSQENAQLREQNKELLQWQEVALALQAQNDHLKAILHYVPIPTPKFFTGEVVADLGGVYARSVLVVVPATDGNPKDLVGAIAMDGRGLAGRVVDVGDRSARILLVTDINSRIPVAIGAKGIPALMAGNNSDDPTLLYWSANHPPAEGAMVLTSAQGGAFPPGLPIGVVHYNINNQPVVLPLANLSALHMMRIFSYQNNLQDLTPVPHTMPHTTPHGRHVATHRGSHRSR